MKILNIKTIWQGQATMRDKYWSEIKDRGEDLQFVYTGDDERFRGQKMTIANADISGRVFRRAKMKVPDKFSKEYHILLYFKWFPDAVKPNTLPI